METALARAMLYNLLAAAFGDPPTPELAAAMAELVPAMAATPREELGRAYTRLLVGPGRDYAPPYASVYLDTAEAGKPQLWGPAAVTAESAYREAGLAIAPGQARVPDHLALELQFMQHLCAREADACARGEAGEAAGWRARQRAFLREQLWPWLPQFVQRVDASNAHPAYRALAEFTRAFVQSDLSEN